VAGYHRGVGRPEGNPRSTAEDIISGAAEGSRARRPSVLNCAHHTHPDRRRHDQPADGDRRPGLYAAGEVAGGDHGANRLGSNALTEAWVFGAIVGREAAAYAWHVDAAAPPDDAMAEETARLNRFTASSGTVQVNALHAELQDLMWRQDGLVRRDNRVRQGLEELEALREKLPEIGVNNGRNLQRRLKLEAMTRAGEIIILSAIERRESRGTDLLKTDDINWLAQVNLRLSNAKLQFTTEKITPGAVPPG